MGGKNNRVTVKKASLCRLFFIKPSGRRDLRDTAEKLLDMKDTIEVLVSEGSYGLIVRACQAGREDPLRSHIAKNFRGRFGEVTCHYAYRK